MKSTTNIFTYGTLMYPEVMYRLVQKKDYKSQPALLHGYTRYQVKKAHYPGLVKDPSTKTKGILYHNMEASDVKILHRFEGAEYIPIEVTVETEKGQKISTLAYLYADPSNLEKRDWDYEAFEKNHKSTFAMSHTCPK